MTQLGIQITPDNFQATIGYGANNLSIAMEDARKIGAHLAGMTDAQVAAEYSIIEADANSIKAFYVTELPAVLTAFDALISLNKLRGLRVTKQYVNLG